MKKNLIDSVKDLNKKKDEPFSIFNNIKLISEAGDEPLADQDRKDLKLLLTFVLGMIKRDEFPAVKNGSKDHKDIERLQKKL